jgi:hypothetical protein
MVLAAQQLVLYGPSEEGAASSEAPPGNIPHIAAHNPVFKPSRMIRPMT